MTIRRAAYARGVGELVLEAFRLLLLEFYSIEAFVQYLSNFVCCINSTSFLLVSADPESRVVLTDLPPCSACVGLILLLYWGHGAAVTPKGLYFSYLVEEKVIRRLSAKSVLPSLFNFHVFNYLGTYRTFIQQHHLNTQHGRSTQPHDNSPTPILRIHHTTIPPKHVHRNPHPHAHRNPRPPPPHPNSPLHPQRLLRLPLPRSRRHSSHTFGLPKDQTSLFNLPARPPPPHRHTTTLPAAKRLLHRRRVAHSQRHKTAHSRYSAAKAADAEERARDLWVFGKQDQGSCEGSKESVVGAHELF